VPCISPSNFYPNRAERDVKLVVNHDDMAEGDTMKMRYPPDRLPAAIHKGGGLHQERFLPIEPTSPQLRIPLVPPSRHPRSAYNLVDHQETSVMASISILLTGVSETYDEKHMVPP
jgi:hypothetical protein